MLLRARIVLPVSQRPIENGAILIARNRIVAVGSWTELKSSVSKEKQFDLGDSILLPGLINAHCHLDYTDMAGQISPPKHFPDWIKAILALKAGWSYSEFAQSWIHGAKMLLQTGTTTVADIEAVPELLPDVWASTPLRVHSFLELTNVKSRRPASEILKEVIEKIDGLPAGRNGAGLSPHALYSTSPDLLKLSASLPQSKKIQRLTTHVAESIAEFEMFQHERGPLFNWLKTQRDMSDCGTLSPVAQIARCGMLSPHFLAVHVNYLAPGDAELLGKSGSSVVHCPRSHAYFGHQKFPYKELQKQNVNLCLGTDSLASTRKKGRQAPELNLFAEMQTLSANALELSPETILRMATVNGAHALGLEKKIGELTKGSLADLISLPYRGSLHDACDAVVHSNGRVNSSMIHGHWTIPPASAEI